jgi:lysophospholipase L1-like esterase
MMKRIKPIFGNLLLVIGSICFCLILLEFFVFRFVLVASDFPKLDFVDDVLKYKPDQEGIYRVKNEIKARFKINGTGWNSRYDHYRTDRAEDKLRVAVIGDSKVEAFQVNYDESLAEQIERASRKLQLEAYRFAISGAPLSQYLHLLRNEALRYSPDLVVIILVHNDFDESYLPTPGVYTRSFLKIDLANDTVQGEIAPLEYETPWYGYIRNSATWRYLTYRQHFQFRTLRNLIFRRQEQERQTREADVEGSKADTKTDTKMVRNRLVTEYIFKQMKKVCNRMNADLLIVMEGDTREVYKEASLSNSKPEGVLVLNAMAASVAKELNIHFIDLQPIFQKDFQINRKKFYFDSDDHWNTHAHKVVAHTVVDFINSQVRHLQK